jgi:hypothetical protein
MRIGCEIDYTTLVNDDGYDVDGVTVACSRCGHQTESFGQSERSIKRCLVLMREECPKGENNFYVEDAGDPAPQDLPSLGFPPPRRSGQ